LSTTTIGDLLDRAEMLARSLRTSGYNVTAVQWRSFDVTAYRLLHELVGPERAGTRDQIVSHATVGRMLNGYPSPLAAPNSETTYNARQAASRLGVSRWKVTGDIRDSRLPATYDGRRYSIKATDLSSMTHVAPADPASTHPLDQLSSTLGVLADMVVAERARTTTVPGFDPLREDAHVAPVIARVLAMTVFAARHALANIPLQDANRPLVIAQYAERSLDSLGDVDRPSALTQVPSFAPPVSPRGPNEQLEAALREWATRARMELARTVPSTEVLRDIANQARHLYAVSARLVAGTVTTKDLPEHAPQAVHLELRAAAQAMQTLQQQWATVTTATRPSHEYVTATTTLHASLSAIERESLLPVEQVDVAKRIDVNQALVDLRYATTDLVELAHIGAQLPEPLIRAKVLFAPAWILPSTMERARDRSHGKYVAIQLKESAALINAAQAGSNGARNAQATLNIWMRPAAASDLCKPNPADRSSSQGLAPATSFGGTELL
jgi:hypothetical protein